MTISGIPSSSWLPAAAPASRSAGCTCGGKGCARCGKASAAADASNPSAASAQSPNDNNASAPRHADGRPLSDDEAKEVAALKQRDAEVRRHEAAHLAAAAGNARSGPVYDYRTGPDGNRYAVGGHVDIDVSPVAGNPTATLNKMQAVQRAALAPADPSGQDRAVAAQAAATAAKARAELAKQGPAVDGTGSGASDGAAAAPSRALPTAKSTAAGNTASGGRRSAARAGDSSDNGQRLSRAYRAADNSSPPAAGRLLDVAA